MQYNIKLNKLLKEKIMSALNNLKRTIKVMDAGFEEGKHKRASNGQFGSGSSSATSKESPKAAAPYGKNSNGASSEAHKATIAAIAQKQKQEKLNAKSKSESAKKQPSAEQAAQASVKKLNSWLENNWGSTRQEFQKAAQRNGIPAEQANAKYNEFNKLPANSKVNDPH